MRFDVQMACIQPMIDEGDVDIKALAVEIEKSITEIVNRVTEWAPCINEGFARKCNAESSSFLWDSIVTYDFS